MSNLESIVPPLELCKRIPAGEFEDSTLVYRFDHQQAGKIFPETNEDERFFYVEEREMVEFAQRNMVNPPPMFPAPTLEEIRRKLRNLSIVPGDDVIHVSCKIDPENWVSAIAVNENDVTAAALRIWFEVKGINLE